MLPDPVPEAALNAYRPSRSATIWRLTNSRSSTGPRRTGPSLGYGGGWPWPPRARLTRRRGRPPHARASVCHRRWQSSSRTWPARSRCPEPPQTGRVNAHRDERRGGTRPSVEVAGVEMAGNDSQLIAMAGGHSVRRERAARSRPAVATVDSCIRSARPAEIAPGRLAGRAYRVFLTLQPQSLPHFSKYDRVIYSLNVGEATRHVRPDTRAVPDHVMGRITVR
jgi:hypothetical protein